MSASPILAAGITDDTHFIRRVRRWMRYRRELVGFVIDVLCVLIEEGATGRIHINMTRGGVASIEFEEQAELTDPAYPS